MTRLAGQRLSQLALCVVASFATRAALAAPLANVVSVAVGSSHACAIVAGGAVKCWGSNSLGQLTTANPPAGSASPVDIPSLSSGIAAIAAGTERTCVVNSTGGVLCWGFNTIHGELGDGTTVTRSSSNLPTPVVGLSSGVTAISAGEAHTCVVTSTGGAMCWGANDYGQLGDGTLVDRLTPVPVSGLSSGVVAIAAGGTGTCALLSGGSVKCWGEAILAGNGTAVGEYTTPQDVTGLPSGVTAISLGEAHACALTAAGGVKCWGHNYFGQLGDGTFVDRATPADVVGLASGATALAAGATNTCVVVSGGAECWGSNGFGELGDGMVAANPPEGILSTTEPGSNTPRDVVSLPGAIAAIDAWGTTVCALTTGANAACWGYDSSGEVGNGAATMAVPLPALVGSFAAQFITFGALAPADVSGGTVPLSATASSGLPVSFLSWAPDACTVSGSTVTPIAMGICTIAAVQPGDSATSQAPYVLRSFLVSDVMNAVAPRLSNIATRALVSTGQDVMIAGFVIGGSTPKTVLLRSRGPSLAPFGVTNYLAQSVLVLTDAAGHVITQVVGSGGNQMLQQIGLAPGNASEPAALVTLAPGAYTAMVVPNFAPAGVATVEVFELDHPESPLLNISTRARVMGGDNVMIAGFIVSGNAPRTVIVTATGPSLSAFGVTSPLADPTLTLVRSSDRSIVATNDDWQAAANASAVQASGFAPSDSKESAILVTLDPGAYTAIVRGANGAIGTSVVGVFAVP